MILGYCFIIFYAIIFLAAIIGLVWYPRYRRSQHIERWLLREAYKQPRTRRYRR